VSAEDFVPRFKKVKNEPEKQAFVPEQGVSPVQTGFFQGCERADSIYYVGFDGDGGLDLGIECSKQAIQISPGFYFLYAMEIRQKKKEPVWADQFGLVTVEADPCFQHFYCSPGHVVPPYGEEKKYIQSPPVLQQWEGASGMMFLWWKGFCVKL